ncbi:uncharacterized protein LOC130777181 [Actinidia eriantha]|uniref:uncharacterized protein LOC130777181 n=1 Tax=Actinidia eriantha TaxID=165200 RepID=UPI002589D897|nr:uncharacterized protein LOC130777181 [Actinidia eriantha]
MSTVMEHRRDEAAGHDFNLRDWAVKAKMVSRENTNSRRFSASYIRSFREDTRSFRSNITISSTASSPGYTLKEEIDPSTYSFTAAIKALQARSAYSWECLSPDGLALNSKWNEAEKYICNPLSGEVPLECLSAKTLSGRLFPNMAGRITMSAPLIYPSHSRLPHTKPSLSPLKVKSTSPSKRVGSMTRDVGTQSTPPELSSGRTSPSPAPTPSIEERPIKQDEAEMEDSPTTNLEKLINLEKKVEVKETRDREDTKRKEQQKDEQQKREKAKQMCNKCRHGGCLSWRSFLCMKKRQREKHKSRSINNNNVFIHHMINRCMRNKSATT